MSNKEYIPGQQEQQKNPGEVAELGAEHREALRDARERAAEIEKTTVETRIESAHHEAIEKATKAEKAAEKSKIAERSPAERRRGPISKAERNISYKATMKEIQTHMSPTERAFSKFIHNKAVDSVSEALGNTVARPNAILSGAVAAFLFSLATLLVAKHYGYRLSGFEAIGAFIAGWLIGILYDFLKVMITGKK